MSRGKYSPFRPSKESYEFNAYGKPVVERSEGSSVPFDEKTMFGDYDDEGFDRYGYSCFSAEGEYVGLGAGIDRHGKTELDYLQMSDEDFDSFIFKLEMASASGTLYQS